MGVTVRSICCIFSDCKNYRLDFNDTFCCQEPMITMSRGSFEKLYKDLCNVRKITFTSQLNLS